MALTITGMEPGPHSVQLKLIPQSGVPLLSGTHWVTAGGRPFNYDDAAARRDAGASPVVTAPLYDCVMRHTSTITPALWILDAQAWLITSSAGGTVGGMAHEYTGLAVGASPHEGSFWAYHACALYMKGLQGGGGCQGGPCEEGVVGAFEKALGRGVVSIEAGGYIQEMVSADH